MESYCALVTCVIINLISAELDTPQSRFSFGLSVTFACVVAVFPLVVLCILCRSDLKQRATIDKFGGIYKEFNTNSKRFIWEPMFFLVRRVILGLVMIV